MTAQELRSKLGELNWPIERLWYKSGVHLDVLKSFMAGETDDLNERFRIQLEALVK